MQKMTKNERMIWASVFGAEFQSHKKWALAVDNASLAIEMLRENKKSNNYQVFIEDRYIPFFEEMLSDGE